MARRTLGNMRATVLRRVGTHSQITAADVNAILQDVHREIATGWQWSFRKRETLLATVAPVSAGTVTVTQGSAAVVGVGTAWTAAMVGRAISIAGENTFYVVQAVADATHLTLGDAQGTTLPWTAASASGASATIFQHQYSIPANVAIIFEQVRDWPLTETTIERLNGLDPMRASFGLPDRFALARATIVDASPAAASLSGTVGLNAGDVSVNVAAALGVGTYTVTLTPSWNTATWVTGKTSGQFTVTFSTPAPAGATLTWNAVASGSPSVDIPLGATTAITAGVVSQAIPVTMPDALYKVVASPSWNTVVWVTGKTAQQFVANFSTPAPAGATIDWHAVEILSTAAASIESRFVELWPVPSAAMAFRMPYLIEPPDLTQDGQLPVCPSEPIECRASAEAAWLLYSKTGDGRWNALGQSYYLMYTGNPTTGLLGALDVAVRDDEARFGLPRALTEDGMEISQNVIGQFDWGLR